MADGKRVYQIEINGIKETTSAVDALNKQLDELERRINALQAKSVNIGTSSTGTKGGSKSALSEEEKLARQIEQIDAKREAYSKKIYQNYMAAKDVLKETVNDQKQIAASERLQANNYTNTMKGLKDKLADIKSVMQTTDIGSDVFKKYTQEANALTEKLKQLEEAYGQFGRNVGNYKSAAEGFEKIKVAVGDATREYDNYRQAMKSLMQERFQLAQSVGQESKAYKDVDIALKQLQSTYQDLNRSSQFMDNMLDTMESFTAVASVGTGLSILFGIDDSEFNETMQRLGALLLVLKSIETLKQQWQKDEGWFFKPFKHLQSGFEKLGATAALKFDKAFKEKAMDALKWYEMKMFDTLGAGKYADRIEKIWGNRKRDVGEENLSDAEFEAKRKQETEAVLNKARAFDTANESMKEHIKVLVACNTASVRYANTVGRLPDLFKKVLTGVKLLSRALTAIAGSLFLMALPEILNFFGDFIKSLNTTKIAAENAENSLKSFNRQLEIRRDLLNASFLRGELTNEEYLKNLYEEQTNALIKQIDVIRTRAKALKNDFNGISDIMNFFDATQNTEFSGQKLVSPMTVGHGRLSVLGGDFGNDLEITVNNIEEVEKAWKNCVKAIENGNDYFTQNGSGIIDWFNSLVVTVKDTEEVMRGLGNVGLSDFISRFEEINQQYKNGKISAEQYAVEIGKLTKEMNNNEMLNSVVANLDKYIPDEGVREAVQNIINELLRLDDAFNMTSEQQVRYWNQVRIDTMKDGLKKTLAQIDENQRIEIKEHGRTDEQIRKIEAKYEKQRQDARDKENKENAQKAKEANKKLMDAENQLIALRIENMKEGLKKRLAELDNQRRLEIQKVKENGIKVGEITAEINKKYDKLILDEKRKWAFETLKVYEDLAARIEQLNEATMQTEASTASQNVETRARRQQESAGYSMITPTSYDDSKALEQYYAKVVEIKKEAAEKELQIERERLDKEVEYQKKEEELRHSRLVNADGGEYITQLRAGLISQEQYDKLIENENDAHYARMNAIDKQYASNLSATTQDTLEEEQKLYSDYYGNIINNLRSDKAKIDEIMSKQPVTDKQGWGVVNTKQTRANYQKALDEYEKIRQKIVEKQSQLRTDLNEGRISPEAFAMRQKEIDQEMKAIDNACKNVRDRQKQLIADFMQSIQQYIQAGVQSFQDIMSAVWAAQDNNFEKEQEELDKLNDELDKKLDKQREIIEEHTNNVDSLEEELANSRGSRRQHLIDQINAEIAAQRAAQAEEQRIQKEKETAQKKQDKLELKRKKAQYKRDQMQAIVNGAMAVTYAAMNTYPIPAIPMMALAAATTAAQLAIMAANKPYAKGGVLEGGVAVGKRHRDGGIPVLGGRASIEGGEYITDRMTTAKNVDLLDYINGTHKKLDLDDFIDFYSSGKAKKKMSQNSPKRVFADGGIIPTLSNDYDIQNRLITSFEAYNNRPVVVSVVDINNRQAAVRNVRVLAGLSE